jgi:RNA polymerase sigma-32 factor
MRSDPYEPAQDGPPQRCSKEFWPFSRSCPLSDQAVRASPDRKEYLEEGEVKPQVLLSADQERDLARRYRQGDEKAGDQLVCAYLPLVKRCAAQFFGTWEELVQEGFVGLMKAVRGYDPDHGARLGTYAEKWIEAQIREYTMRQSAWLKPPFPPSKAYEVKEKPEAPSSMEDLLRQKCWKMAPLKEGHLVVDEGEDQEKMLADRQERERRRAFLKQALESLSDPERQIIVERHLRDQATPLKDLGVRFGLSGESIRQMELKALKALKGMARA